MKMNFTTHTFAVLLSKEAIQQLSTKRSGHASDKLQIKC